MADRGYYRMYRGWQEHPVFKNEPYSSRDAFEWLIAHAAWQPTRVGLPGGIVEMARGQLSYSVRYLAGAWRWTPAKVQRFLKKMADEKMIETCAKTDTGADTGQTIITVCNYERYQASESDTDTGTDTRAIRQRYGSDTNKKKVKKEKKTTPKKDEPSSWAGQAGELWEQRFDGSPNYGRIGKALRPLVEKHGDAAVLATWERYLAEADPQYTSPEHFAAKYGVWENGHRAPPTATPQYDDPDGYDYR